MPLSDVAQVTVSTTGTAVTRVGFGTPLIADSVLAWGASGDRVRSYRKLADLVSDGFATTDAVYRMAAKMLAQNPAPPLFKVGRRANRPTMRWNIVPVAQDNFKYVVTINGLDAVFTSGVGTTLALIIGGLKTAIDALGQAVTTTNLGPNTSLQIQANVAGAFHSIKTVHPTITNQPHPYLSVLQNHVDPGIAADLDAILAADTDWYGLLLSSSSSAEVVAAAAWIEANPPRMFFASTQDSDTWTSSTTDVMSLLKAAGYTRTAPFYYIDNSAFLAASIAAGRLPTDPGSENWMFTPAPGIPGLVFTASQQVNLDNKNGNYLYNIGNQTFAAKGKVSSGQWIDIIRFLDWIQVNMALDILQLQVNMAAQGKKVPFDDDGITAVQNVVLARLKAGVNIGGLAAFPPPSVSVPKAADVLPADKAARTLKGVTFQGTLTGAINLTTVVGTLV